MILPDHEIVGRCEQFEAHTGPLVFPLEHENVQPASLDVRLGNAFRVFERDATPFIDVVAPVDITKEVLVDHDGTFLLHPGEFVLGHTVERFSIPDDLVARVEGKSSLGRLGLFVHVTAGFIDPGFVGRVTLEMYCVHPLPIMLRPDMLIAQVSFHQLSSPADKPYAGRYQGDGGVSSSRYGQ